MSSFSYLPVNRCDKTAFYSILSFVICTLLAQVVLTVRLEHYSIAVQRLQVDFRECYHRIYAVAKKNIPIAIGFVIITISQLVLGICLVVFAARNGGMTKSSHSHFER